MQITWKNLKSEGHIENFRMISDETEDGVYLGLTTKIYAVPRHKLTNGTVVNRVPVSFNFEPAENSALSAISAPTMAGLKIKIISAVENSEETEPVRLFG
jgi:hypothetical protein